MLSAFSVDASASTSAALRPADLLRITDQGASDVLDGRYDHLLPSAFPVRELWSVRLRSDDAVDVWLVSRPRGRRIELHGRASTSSALTVLGGSLSEYRWVDGELRHRTLESGDQAAFPAGWVHDVVRTPGTVAEPALSVHAYSRPLTTVSYYEVTDSGSLRRTRTELTDLPEGDLA
ncbi:cysteine dioxygenase [Prescottella subtropica]|uniref:cysteine dioxygenase n=1 Tax=Prescottella subtropica TaxID=2545757 RepID=UPI0010F973A2|nr:cysteine dioxygenase [Prescottella subtropica]